MTMQTEFVVMTDDQQYLYLDMGFLMSSIDIRPRWVRSTLEDAKKLVIRYEKARAKHSDFYQGEIHVYEIIKQMKKVA
ncbi:hypothetical protein NVP1081O_169 [Vibrio phage 1.081.O._10N.286.52.C2]|nr:hypothetical protein NVP1081O_169 [Vibrio phage 1.081.O._10N.286.52.C2]